MTSAVEEDGDSILSDVEGDFPSPLEIGNLSPEDVSLERYQELLSELERERQAREAAEASKSELQSSFNRLKVLAHDAIKKRDESFRQRDDAVRERDSTLKLNQQISSDLDEIVKSKDELMKQMDDCSKKLEDVECVRDSLRSEIEASTHMLVSGTDKISGKISSFKNFGAGGLPKSSKYSGFPSVAYGVIKRANEIVEELLKNMESIAKSRDGAQELMEQKNYENAIEVSQLEAAISKLRKDESERNCLVDALEKSIADKDVKISEVEKVMLERAISAENEATRMNELLEKSEKSIDICSSLFVDQMNCISKINDELCNVIRIVDTNELYQSELPESFFPPQPTDIGGNLRVSNARMNSIYELLVVVVDKVRCSIDEKCQGMKDLHDTVTNLVMEKQQIGSLLRTMLTKRLASNSSSNIGNEIVREYKLNSNGAPERGLCNLGELNLNSVEGEDIHVLVGVLNDTMKTLHIEIIEGRHALDELRAEFTVLKERMEVQSIELNSRNHCLVELQEKERVTIETIEGLMFDIATSEEEISRWKAAAEQEAITGKAIEQESEMQMSVIRKEMEEAKRMASESEKKVKYKEEIAAAAINARDAAEKSVMVGDLRAARLRERVEELSQLLEGSGVHPPHLPTNPMSSRYMCWPWGWLGLNFVAPKHPSSSSPDSQGRGSNEMELSEPLI